MTTEAAQRRLLEALAAVQRPSPAEPDPLAAFAAGIRVGQVQARLAGEDASADVFAALADLAHAVRTDLKESRHG